MAQKDGNNVGPDVQAYGSAAASLSLTAVSKQYDTEQASAGPLAVDDLSFVVRAGEFVTLLGPSGCGKTTTLRMIAGFERPTAGEIRIGERSITDVPANKRPISMVFQNYALFPHLSVAENVAFGLKLKRLARADITERVELALTTMNLMTHANKSPSQLSGGQQQRVALARAMVMRPAVMLFDEPLSNLDAKLRAQMRLEIRRLQQRIGTTAVFVTHDQDEAMTMSDRIVVMNAGRMAQMGTPEEIYRRPDSLFVGDFIGRANFVDVDIIAVGEGHAEVVALGRRVTVPCHSRVRADGPAQLLIRPESLRVHPHGADVSTISTGTVVSSAYYGSTVEYELDSPFGPLSATVAAADEDFLSAMSSGAEVDVGFDERQSWLLPGAGSVDRAL